jgi:ArsR family transcriptional regulator
MVHESMDRHPEGLQQDIACAAIGQALGHPIRIEILRLLADCGERCSCEIEPLFPLDQSGISRHLAVLRRAGLIVSRQEGVRILHRIASPRVLDLLRGLDAVVSERVEVAHPTRPAREFAKKKIRGEKE